MQQVYTCEVPLKCERAYIHGWKTYKVLNKYSTHGHRLITCYICSCINTHREDKKNRNNCQKTSETSVKIIFNEDVRMAKVPKPLKLDSGISESR